MTASNASLGRSAACVCRGLFSSVRSPYMCSVLFVSREHLYTHADTSMWVIILLLQLLELSSSLQHSMMIEESGLVRLCAVSGSAVMGCDVWLRPAGLTALVDVLSVQLPQLIFTGQAVCSPDEFKVAVDAWNGGAVDNFNAASNNDWTYSLSSTCNAALNNVALPRSESQEDLMFELDERDTFGAYPRVTFYEDAPNTVQPSQNCNLNFAIFFQNTRVWPHRTPIFPHLRSAWACMHRLCVDSLAWLYRSAT